MAQANVSDADLAILQQALGGVLSNDNTQRSAAEDQLEAWRGQQPDFLLFGLAKLVAGAAEVQLRSHSSVLLRRLAFKATNPESEETTWRAIQADSRLRVREQLLHALHNEADPTARHKVADTIAEFATRDSQNGDAWANLLEELSKCTQSPHALHRESAFRIFAVVPELISEQPTGALKEIFLKGLNDPESQAVRFECMKAAASYLMEVDESVQKELITLMPNILSTFSPVIESRDEASLMEGLMVLIELADNAPRLYRQVLPNMLGVMTNIAKDGTFEDSTRQTALEFLLTIAEAATPMARKVPNFCESIVEVAVEMAADIEEDEAWYTTDDLAEDDNDENYVMGESSLDRVARTFGGKAVVPVAFKYVPQMLQSPDWKQRRAALMTLSSIAEGSVKIMKPELGNIIQMVQPSFLDPHPRVRYAACNTLGQMSTDFAPYLQKNFHEVIIGNLLSVMKDNSQPRVQAHAAAAMVNFCEEANKKILDAYLDPIFEELLVLLKSDKTYVQEQAITTIATVADCAEDRFVKYHSVIMPILLNILINATDQKHRLLRCRSMECASLIALAIGKEQFAPYTQQCIEILAAIQQSETGQDKTGTEDMQSYLLAAWARMCKMMGNDFLPYLPSIMPPLLQSASVMPEMCVPDDEDDQSNYSPEDGWEFIDLNGQQVGIQTSSLEEKHTAMEMLVSYARDLGAGFKDYVPRVLEIALRLLKFYFHDGVRHASAALIPLLLRSAKEAGAAPAELAAMWTEIYEKVIKILEQSDEDIEFLAQLFTTFYESLEVLGENCLEHEQISKFTVATAKHITGFVERLNEREKNKAADGYDAEDDEQQAEEEDSEEDLLGEIARAIQGVFKAHHENFLPFFDKEILPKATQMLSFPNVVARQWAVCVFDDVVEFTGPRSLEYTQYFLMPMINGLKDSAPQVRQAAAYGLGMCGQHGGDGYTDACRNALQALFEMVHQAGSREDENVFATENAISAIGKICRFRNFEDKDSVLASWVAALPLTNDDQEAPFVYGYLLDLLESQHPSVFGANHEGVPHLVKMLAEVLTADILPKELNDRMVHDLRVILAGLPEENRNVLWKSIPVESQVFMQKKGYV